ncbi:hypothetical protein H9P43_003549 [Blastocladiella emersonii ATCC 22665]|nr:hypothetical protein H9P43_003549 [Blastocladiella emersonii ATCC 22665]
MILRDTSSNLMERTSFSIPGPLLARLAHLGHGGSTDGLLFGHVNSTVELSVHDHSMDQHETREVRFVVNDILTFPAGTKWYTPSGTLNLALLTPALASARTKFPGCRVLGHFSARHGAASPGLREAAVWTSVSEQVADGHPCVFLLVQPHADAGGIAAWTQTCFQRHAGDDHTAYRIPIEIPNLGNSSRLARVPPAVSLSNSALAGAGGVAAAAEASVAQLWRVCDAGLAELQDVVNAASASASASA